MRSSAAMDTQTDLVLDLVWDTLLRFIQSVKYLSTARNIVDLVKQIEQFTEPKDMSSYWQRQDTELRLKQIIIIKCAQGMQTFMRKQPLQQPGYDNECMVSFTMPTMLDFHDSLLFQCPSLFWVVLGGLTIKTEHSRVMISASRKGEFESCQTECSISSRQKMREVNIQRQCKRQ